MKKKILTFAVLLLTLLIVSSNSFSQAPPGGSEDGSGDDLPIEGGGTVITPSYDFSSYIFKRNNGNGLGVCGDRAQIRVEFSPMPPTTADIPKLSGIWYQGTNLLISNVAVSSMSIINQTQPYVSYCLTGLLPSPGVSGGNIPPAEKLTLTFVGH